MRENRPASAVPWTSKRPKPDPFADFESDRLMVFVPAIMSVGLVFSIGTLIRDAMQRAGRRSRGRRIAMESAATVAALRGESAADAQRSALLRRSVYVASALLAAGVGIGLAARAIDEYQGGTGDGLASLLFVGSVVALLCLVVAVMIGGVAWKWPAPPPWTQPVLRTLPLVRDPSVEGGGPSRRVGALALGSAAFGLVLTAFAAADSQKLADVDDAMAGWIVDTPWLERLSAIDLFGGTVLSIGFAALIGLSAFRCRVMAVVFPAAFAFSWLTTALLHELIERPRPSGFGDGESFPSGHVVQAVFIAGLLPPAIDVLFGLRPRSRRLIGVGLGTFAMITALIRLNEQAHWPSDVIAGALLGVTTVLGSLWLLGHRRWHRSCDTCPWSPEPGHADWSRGLFAIGEEKARRIRWAGAITAVGASAALLIATASIGLPTDPEGVGVGSAVAEPAQLALAIVMGLAGVAALRWAGPAALVMAVCATAIGLLASVEYTPPVAFLLTAMLLVPALLTWLGWQPTATLGSIAALALITISSLTVTTLGSREIYAHYFGPTHPDSLAEPLDSDAAWLWLGAVDTATATVVAGGLEQFGTAELTYWSAGQSQEAMAAPVDDDGLARFALTDLRPDTVYSYAVTGGSTPTAERPADSTFRTHAVGAQNLRILVGSCSRTGANGAVFDAMVAEEPDLYLALGDLHYASLSSSDPDDHLAEYARALSKPGQSALFRSVPTAYVWDDHDYGPNDGDSTSPSREAVATAFRQAVPHTLTNDDPNSAIAQAFTVGRVRVVLTDTRSQRDDQTMLGDEQLAWLIDELISSSKTHALVVWGNPTPWISSAGADADDWSAHRDERQQIADALVAADVRNLVMASGDAHMVAIDDGTNSAYASDGSGGFPVLHGAALDRPGSTKGGPYSHGSYPGGGQYGRIDITDDGGSTIGVALSGHTWEGEVLVTYEFTVAVPTAASN